MINMEKHLQNTHAYTQMYRIDTKNEHIPLPKPTSNRDERGALPFRARRFEMKISWRQQQQKRKGKKNKSYNEQEKYHTLCYEYMFWCAKQYLSRCQNHFNAYYGDMQKVNDICGVWNCMSINCAFWNAHINHFNMCN